MGTYNQAFRFDIPQVDTHLAFGQGVFIVHSLVKHRCNRICGAWNFGNHYQKSHCKDVVFATNQNHKAACDVLYRRGELLHSDDSPECIYAKGRL
jgi:hypothetical protein